MRFSRNRRNQAADSRGQATVEFALLLPMFVLSLWMLISLSTAVATYINVVQASRNAARAAVLSDPDDQVARDAVQRTTSLRNFTVDITTHDSTLTATVATRYRLPLPFPHMLRPSVVLSASTTMLQEPLLFGE